MNVIYKILKFLSLPLFFLVGIPSAMIGLIKFWHLWTFKDVNLFKYLNDDK